MKSDDAWIGEVVDGYRILEVLGRGGMGVVYRAEHQALRRIEALKVIAPVYARDAYFRRRFQQEAQALGRIHHPHIVAIHTLRESELGLFLTMEYVDGDTLADRIRAHGPLHWTDTLPIVSQLLDALAYAHERGIIHRDIKPRNVMVTPEGTVKVMDFGLARFFREATETRTQEGTTGTLYYMAPEQIVGTQTLDQRCDLYALGMTLYECLTGRLPFDETDSHYVIQRAIVEEVFPPPIEFRGDLPVRLSDVIHRAVAKDPADRFPSARAMQAAIDEVAESKTRDNRSMEDATVTRAPTPGRVPHLKKRPGASSGGASPPVPDSSHAGSPSATGPSTPSRAWRWWTGGVLILAFGVSLFLFEASWIRQADDSLPNVVQPSDAVAGTLRQPSSALPSEANAFRESPSRSKPSEALEAPIADAPTSDEERLAEGANGTSWPSEAASANVEMQDVIPSYPENPSVFPLDDPASEQDAGAEPAAESEATLDREGPTESLDASAQRAAATSETDPGPSLSSSTSSTGGLPRGESDPEANPDANPDANPEAGARDESEVDRKAEEEEPTMRPAVQVEQDAARLADALSRAIEQQEWTTLPNPVEQYYRRALKSLYARHDIVTVQVVPQPAQTEGGQIVVRVATFVSYRQRGRDGVKAVPVPARWIWSADPTGIVLSDVVAD